LRGKDGFAVKEDRERLVGQAPRERIKEPKKKGT
jgi:hypothetical protein